MNSDFEILKAYIDNSSACQEALKPLSKNIDIGLRLDENTDWRVTRENDMFVVQNTPPQKHDVIFQLSTSAIQNLSAADPNSIGEIAVQLMREVKSGEVKILVKSNLFALLKNGYLEIIAKGGKPVWKYLSDHGITNPKKIISIFKDMIKRKV